ncbi:anti-sigma factor [Blastococcus sp. CCUG 61487]|uniref:anti-sigma factor n=1 Tax=Blastococcus sp. CCUG 61487 TaxID=1840703 RepID=UPI0010C05525|nr:anti-sigma factor [Blastococcus sp. CCUG 61487]TKJ30747.1 ABC transporter substrate-binding protein [Blastococcus sp. CCUG 61487]
MQHCTPEQLALAALREPLPDDDAAHLAGCATCTAEVAALRRGVEALAVPQLAAPRAPVPPPPSVWAGIAAATGVRVEPSDIVEARPSAGDAPAPRVEDTGLAEVVPLRSRRRVALLVAAAALAGGVVGAGAISVLQRDEGGEQVTTVALDPLGDNEASGEVQVVRRDDGSRVVELDLDAPDLEDGYYEIWLIDSEVSGMVSLGVAQVGSNVFDLPPGLDLGEFPLVDVSVEPLDGDPTHSGVSVTRGEMST